MMTDDSDDDNDPFLSLPLSSSFSSSSFLTRRTHSHHASWRFSNVISNTHPSRLQVDSSGRTGCDNVSPMGSTPHEDVLHPSSPSSFTLVLFFRDSRNDVERTMTRRNKDFGVIMDTSLATVGWISSSFFVRFDYSFTSFFGV